MCRWTRLLRAAPRGIRATARPRYRQWKRLGAVGRAVAAAIRDRGDGLGGDPRVPPGVPRRCAAPRGATRLGRHRPAQGASTRVEDADPRLPPVPTSPAGRHRDGSRWAHWRVNGDTAYFMGYRPSYLLSRSLFHMRRDRSAFALMVGYAAAGLRRSPRLDDPGARAVLRRDQSLRTIARRRREARGPAD